MFFLKISPIVHYINTIINKILYENLEMKNRIQVTFGVCDDAQILSNEVK